MSSYTGIMISSSLIALFTGMLIGSVLPIHQSEPIPAKVEAVITAPAVAMPCQTPKFSVGDKVKTVLPKWVDEEGREHPLIAQVINIEGLSSKNHACIYSIGHYSSLGVWDEDTAYEFELVRY